MNYYLIGIKGSGMSALACLLFDLGYSISGYDDSSSYKFTMDGLEKRNIKIYHNNTFIPTKDTIVCYSNAFNEKHPEIVRMKELNIQMIGYQELIGDLTKKYETISVSGTHGKTTTSLMISNVLDKSHGTNYFVGDGRGHGNKKNKLFILESCEYNKHFLSYYPKTLVITNIELEHTECYDGIDDIIKTFNTLVNQTTSNIVLCGDDLNVLKIKTDKNKYYYGFNDNNDLIAKNIYLEKDKSSFDVYYKGNYFDHYDLQIFGKHMILDSLACIMVSILYNVDKSIIKESLSNFKGATRRFNETKIDDTVIIDDYAHHPTEINVTLESIKQKYPEKEKIAVFLPNTYSRTEALFDDFVNVFNKFDYSYIMDIKCDRENKNDYPNISSDKLINSLNNASKIDINSINKLLNHKGSVICFMSCANINDMILELKSKLN